MAVLVRRAADSGEDLPGLRRVGRGGLRHGASRDGVLGGEDPELQGRPLGTEADHVAVVQRRVPLDARAVDERPVPAAQILDDERVAAAHDGGVAGRHVEIALGVESDVREGMAPEADVGLDEGFGLSDPRPREKLELGLHWPRFTQYSTPATIATASSAARIRRQRACFAGTGGGLPL